MKDAYYFSHDANARNDPKILAMRSVYGSEGYGLYWMVIEILREQTDYKLPLMKYTINALAMQMQCECIRFEQFINDCCTDFALLDRDDSFLWCDSLLKRMIPLDDKREKRRMAADQRWDKHRADALAMQMQCEEDTNAMLSKVKQSKAKESNTYTAEFESFWSEYPREGHQNSKPQSFKNFKSLIKKKIDPVDLIQAAKNYATDCKTLCKVEYLYKVSNFIGQAEYYKSYLDEVWEPAQQELFTNKTKMNKREQQLDEIGRMFKEYDRCNSQQNNNDVLCKLS